jgi:hypothetical protein
MIKPTTISIPEAVKLSYPTAIELSDKVGLKIINKKARDANFFNLVFDICEAKKYAAYEKIAD